MKLLIDMNLSPRWVHALQDRGYECVHWSAIGDPGASDAELMPWAVDNGHVVLTHDLDFGAILAATKAEGPSVVQIRTQDVLPEAMESLLVQILQRHGEELEIGALVVLEEARSRVRILPLSR
ncbi:MAG TPA: DUF5615 family PIN-like protein [Phycisphaerae bacterium]|nr:DUF5615 family PIN-like protein [Phycisphaerae bacterium]HUU23548.1 DUF5615 family PIN-like protein [Phycisphaerae bacterium]